MEGALIRVVAYSSLINQDMNADLAAVALKDIVPNSKPKVITINDIQRVVGDHFSIKLDDFKAKNAQRMSLIQDRLRCIYPESLLIFHYRK
ncbi:hypothetical protein [Anaerobacillus sp. CMMVII]|uniref:hypothetical protein n=1 Tax=Anaerobacillus sp. CMMVII TaxID=2755588 RepID=UPI0037BF53FD